MDKFPVEKYRAMWEWIAQHAYDIILERQVTHIDEALLLWKAKHNWLAKYDPNAIDICMSCYGCEYCRCGTSYDWDCEKCPLDFKLCCSEDGSLYAKLLNALAEEDYYAFVDYALQIKDVKLKGGIEIEVHD